MINDKATDSGAPAAQSLCEVCGRARTMRPFYASDSLVCGDEEECYRLGYEREKAAREAAEHRVSEVSAGRAQAGDYVSANHHRRVLAEERNRTLYEAAEVASTECGVCDDKHLPDGPCLIAVKILALAEETAARSAAPKALLNKGSP